MTPKQKLEAELLEARRIAKAYNRKQVVVFTVDRAGRFQYSVYGEDRGLADAMLEAAVGHVCEKAGVG
jgi:hypothetical protein